MPPTLTYVNDDLFSAAPRGSVLVHACNTVGSWGGGIAVEFAARFPSHFAVYRAYCEEHDSKDLLGTCLLISGSEGEEGYDVACLFTSRFYGKRKDKPERILEYTKGAVGDLMRKNVGGKELHACRFNSGKFGVPWEETEKVLKELEVTMTIYTPRL